MKRMAEWLITGGLISSAAGLIGYLAALSNGWEGTGPDHWTWDPIGFGLLAMFVGAILFASAKLSEHWSAKHNIP